MGNIETINKAPLEKQENFSTFKSKLLKNEIELEEIEKMKINHDSFLIQLTSYGKIVLHDLDDVSECKIMLETLEDEKTFETEKNILLSAENDKLKERIGYLTKLADMWKSKGSMMNWVPIVDLSSFSFRNVVTLKSKTGMAKWNLGKRHTEFDMPKWERSDDDYIKMRSIKPIFNTNALYQWRIQMGFTNVELPEKHNIFFQKQVENSIMGIGFKYFRDTNLGPPSFGFNLFCKCSIKLCSKSQ